MASPPSGEPGSPATSAPQPLPHPQPTKAHKPSSPGSKKTRQRRQAAQTSPAVSPAVPVYPSSRAAVLQPYPPSPYHIMNPSYPINGAPSPFTQHHHYPSQSSPPVNQTNAPPHVPHAPQYAAYPVHPSAYPPPHPYSHYPQYHQPMMMYTAPRTSAPPDTPQSLPSPSLPSPSASGHKRKRRPDGVRVKPGDKASDDDELTTSGGDSRPQQQSQPPPPSMIDVKKRTKTQRACDSCRSRKIRCDILPDSEPPRCQHCKQYGFECTFFLPITETRFKKKKLEDETEKERAVETTRATTSAQTETQNRQDIGVLGPTSAPHLLHSQASISARIYENYDLRWHHKFEVSQKDGLIQVQRPNNEDKQVAHPKPVDLHIEPETVEELLNAYFTDVAPVLPIMTRSEFLANPSPPLILIYSMCLVAAARRDIPQTIFDTIRHAVNSIIKAEDVLSTASTANVQALLILSMTGDCHSQFVSSALSALWIRLGVAIRMAQDLGIHRCESVKQDVELRRRLWGACLICDRWTSLTYGHPFMIDVQDCDARLPSSGDSNDLYMDELVRLSVILGRVSKAIYSPSGLTFTTNEQLYQLMTDLDAWKAGLPEQLQFKGMSSSRSAGLLHLLYSCVCLMFWRVFMRISYSCPTHLKFGMTVEKWTELVELTSQSIDWLDANEKIYDVWLLVAYAATSCALVQYHTWARRKDNEAAAKLRKLRDCVRRWEASISPDHRSARRKTAEIIALLYEATQVKQPIGLEYKKDPSLPGGGVFIAHGDAKRRDEDLKDVPPGVVIRGTSDDELDTGEEQGISSAPPISDERGRNERRRASLMSPSPFAPPLTDVGSPSTNTAGDARGSGLLQSAMRNALQAQSAGACASGVTQRGPSLANVNPAMNTRGPTGSNQVQVMDILDGQPMGGTLADFAMVDNGFLEGIPGSMFDWGQWDTFFSRFSNAGMHGGESTRAITNLMYPQQQPPRQ